ncbi:MAG: hypothetical protein B1H08_06255 [Candidatus Omnitrophica bacterium 4484_171]|nr:MAG: hypothetical protein B1H08_06255 [Candidatus Omnitrophica bacterium 4484_171]
MIKRKRKINRVTVKTAKTTDVSKKRNAGSVSTTFDFTLNTIMEYIRTRAYYIWEDLGKPQGKDNDIWQKAEKDVLSKLIKKR